jgi:hypothetical protein
MIGEMMREIVEPKIERRGEPAGRRRKSQQQQQRDGREASGEGCDHGGRP